MGLSDSKQKSTGSQSGATTASYDYKTPPTTPALAKLADAKFEVDPGITAQYSNLRSRLKSGFNNPLGANYSPEVRDAMLRSGEERLGQDEAQAYRGGQYDVNRLNYSRDATVAGMSQPQLVNTGSTSSGTSSGTITQSTSPVGAILNAGASVAPLSL